MKPDQFKLLVYFRSGPGENGRTFYCRKLARARKLVNNWEGKFSNALIYAPANQGAHLLEHYDQNGLLINQRSTL